MTMAKRRILLVDDDVDIRGSVAEALSRKGHDVVECVSGEAGLSRFRESAFDLVVSDMKMPGMSGAGLLERIREANADVPFVIMTAFGDVETAVDAMRKGAYDFIEKGERLLDKLEFAVERALERRSLVAENARLLNTLQKQCFYVGRSAAMEDIRSLIDTIAKSRSTVLVSGESGTGKELIARSIHHLSTRHQGPFVKVNCAALPDGLIESELFGHEKGSFTGALKTRAGKFELASGGTLLLDEIGEMSSGMQAKLLRVLQEREVNKVGADEPTAVDVRIVATTNRNLKTQVAEGKFREDLYYRLNVFDIHLPPLRERMQDIPELVEHFVRVYNEENGFGVTRLENDALRVLEDHTWPGNIRELENAIERAVVLTRSGPVGADVFSFSTFTDTRDEGLKPGMTVWEAEKELLLKTLEFCSQNRTRAAEMLGISIRTLRNKLNEYDGKKV